MAGLYRVGRYRAGRRGEGEGGGEGLGGGMAAALGRIRQAYEVGGGGQAAAGQGLAGRRELPVGCVSEECVAAAGLAGGRGRPEERRARAGWDWAGMWRRARQD